jgi:hypothetical protein
MVMTLTALAVLAGLGHALTAAQSTGMTLRVGVPSAIGVVVALLAIVSAQLLRIVLGRGDASGGGASDAVDRS